MNIRTRIRQWLGITEIQEDQTMIVEMLRGLSLDIVDFKHKAQVSNRLNAELLAKLNPLRAIPEDDPARIAESQRLGEEVLKRISGEVKASNSFGN